jgi:hypothetical protein
MMTALPTFVALDRHGWLQPQAGEPNVGRASDYTPVRQGHRYAQPRLRGSDGRIGNRYCVCWRTRPARQQWTRTVHTKSHAVVPAHLAMAGEDSMQAPSSLFIIATELNASQQHGGVFTQYGEPSQASQA